MMRVKSKLIIISVLTEDGLVGMPDRLSVLSDGFDRSDGVEGIDGGES